MPSRFQNNTREWVYLYLVARDGLRCFICGKKPTEKRRLEIDHADQNPENKQPQNLHLLCRACNLELRNMPASEHVQIIAKHTAKNVRESERKDDNENKKALKRILEYEYGSSEMRASSYYESRYREWIIEQLKHNGLLPRKEAINSGAEFVGCSPITISRYLDKLTSFEGILQITKDGSNFIVTMRPVELKIGG